MSAHAWRSNYIHEYALKKCLVVATPKSQLGKSLRRLCELPKRAMTSSDHFTRS